MTTRTITTETVNLGRGGRPGEFSENLARIRLRTPGQHRFYGFQEIDEADEPDEHKALKLTLGAQGYTFAGWKTHVPIAVPPGFKIKRRIVKVASEGVDHLSPRRHVVTAVVHPDDHPDCLLAFTNTHFARDAEALARVRSEADEVLRNRIRANNKAGLSGFLTADLNSRRYRSLGAHETKIIGHRLDYVRSYEPEDGASIEVLDTGVVDLTIDGHNAHWAKAKVTW